MVDDREGAVVIVSELFHGDTATKASPAWQLARVVEEIAMSLEVGHAAVVGKRLCFFQGHDCAPIRPWAFKRRSRAVGYMLRHAAGSIEQIVEWLGLLGGLSFLVEGEHVAAQDPGTLGVAVLILHVLLTLFRVGCAKALHRLVDLLHLAVEREHVAVQTGVIDGGIAPEEPGLPVVLNEYRGVNVIPAAVVEERFAEGIAERPCGRVGHGHADGHAVGQLGVGTDVPIELAVALNALGCPGTVVGPAEAVETEQRAVVGPVHHVAAGIGTPFVHPEEIGIVLVVSRIDVNLVAMHHRGGVAGKPCLHHRVLCRAKRKMTNGH